MININVKQLSSLEKIRNLDDILEKQHLASATVFQGEHYAYQFAIFADARYKMLVEIESPLKEYVTPYFVDSAVMDFPVYFDNKDDDYITKEPGLMPDILVPIEERGNIINISNTCSLWIDVNIPKKIKPGIYTIKVKIKNISMCEYTDFEVAQIMEINILDEKIAEQELVVTQWLHADCIASVHNVEIYSEQHWNLIDEYIRMASELGINMILTPVLTPHLDTDFGVERPNVQLVDITYSEAGYKFDFTRLKRWIAICKKNKIKYFEIAHLFSQWGLKCTPNILVKEGKQTDYMFGWHVKSDSELYVEFLNEFLPKLMKVLKEEGVMEKTYFHLSDEPTEMHTDKYKFAHDLVKPLIEGCKIIEACSNAYFYENKLMDIPVACTNSIDDFINKGIDNLFAYYCCSGNNKVGNRFLAMPSYRNRVLGLQMYKFSISGFLQWGYNFYYNGGSNYVINPYATTSADRHFPSGDPFSVYPGKNGPLSSTRAKVFLDALQDIQVCKMLEKYIGKDEVIKLIENEAGMEITFKEYPRSNDFYYNLNAKMKKLIAKHITATTVNDDYNYKPNMK